MQKLIYNSDELIQYYREKGITCENFNQLKLKNNSMLEMITPLSDDKTLFYPYIGEFGTAVTKYMHRFHYTPSKYKIACIPKGYECFFPSAKEFAYDFPGPKWDEYHNGIKWDGPQCVKRRYFSWNLKAHTRERIEFKKWTEQTYGTDVTLRHIKISLIKGPIKDTAAIRTFMKIPFKIQSKYGIKTDVVFSNRKFDKDARSFQKWKETVEYIQRKGLTVGGIGKKELSFDNLNITNNFDYDNPNEASIEMLSNAKYYIGTDTGVTHLAMNFPHLKSILFRLNDGSVDWIEPYKGENTRLVYEMYENMKAFNDEQILFKHIDEIFV